MTLTPHFNGGRAGIGPFPPPSNTAYGGMVGYSGRPGQGMGKSTVPSTGRILTVVAPRADIELNGHRMVSLATLPAGTMVATGTGPKSPHLLILGRDAEGRISIWTPAGPMWFVEDVLVHVVKAPPTWMP